jgi:hypothetical protein
MRSTWPRRFLLAGACVAAAIALFAIAGHAMDVGSYDDCDNMAGECLRYRQQYALEAIGLGAGLIALACLWAALRAVVFWIARWQLATLLVGLALIASVSVAHPADHLDNRWHGWLSDD